MALERGLGKGLGALLGDAALQSQEGGSLSLPISQVEPGLKQPRKRFDEESLQDLADSIRIHGIIQPLTVRRLSSGYYQIIAGERRWRAVEPALRVARPSRPDVALRHRGRRPQGDGARPH
jgi:ParB family chromosome partitioning protein